MRAAAVSEREWGSSPCGAIYRGCGTNKTTYSGRRGQVASQAPSLCQLSHQARTQSAPQQSVRVTRIDASPPAAAQQHNPAQKSPTGSRYHRHRTADATMPRRCPYIMDACAREETDIVPATLAATLNRSLCTSRRCFPPGGRNTGCTVRIRQRASVPIQ